MFKKRFFLFCLFCLFLFSGLTGLTACTPQDCSTARPALAQPEEAPPLMHLLHPDAEVRGVWIASVHNIDYPSQPDLSAAALQAELDDILAVCRRTGLNTVFFQVRPSCDALYNSTLFPVSPYLSKDGTLPFDPLAYLVEQGHHQNIRVHAWINPLRVTVRGTDLDALPENSPARLHPDWVVPYADGKLYFNAGLPEVRQLIADGVAEVVRQYDVDGVVFDDYFYPYPKNGEDGRQIPFDDAEAYAAYGKEFDSPADWRRHNINTMIQQVSDTIRSLDDACLFGVSPVGVWQNDDGQNGGSRTRGFEGYHSLYSDALAWAKAGSIDYLSPQIYWTFTDKAAPFDVLVRWWNAALDGSGVELWPSHASYRYEEGDWTHPEGQLTEQIAFARAEKAYRGSICYGYDEIKRNVHGAADDLRHAYDRDIIYTDIHSNGRKPAVSSPADGAELTSDTSYILGVSDPFYPLFVTGGGMTEQKVSQTKSGYFNLYVKLEPGENIFRFEQNGEETVYTLFYGKNTAAVPDKPKPAPEKRTDTLQPKLTYPLGDVVTDEDILWVSCEAPAGSDVTAAIGGITTKLTPLEKTKLQPNENGYPVLSYGVNAKLPPVGPEDLLDCGQIRLTVTHPDGTAETEGGQVRVRGADAFLCIRVKNSHTPLKITEKSSYYNDYTVQSAGMIDYAVSLRSGFYRLRMGGYVPAEDAEEITDPLLFPEKAGRITSASVYNAGRQTEFRIRTKEAPPYNAAVEDGRFVVTFYNMDASTAPMPSMGENPLLRSCQIVRLDDRVRYSFELYHVENFYGFDLHYEDGAAVVTLRNPMRPGPDPKRPLEGVRIVLDAGHGGADNGARGALAAAGLPGNEKDLNLSMTLLAAEQLRELGADVILPRTDDSTLDLYARMDLLDSLLPDLCVSIHQNAIDFSGDITRTRGTLGLWCMDGGRMLAETVAEAVAHETGRAYRGSRYQALAVCRNPKFPAALIEVSFITSVEEYEAMTSDDGLARAADGICRGILNYFQRQAYYA